MKHLLISSAIALGVASIASAGEVTVARFFGDCENAGTDTTTTTGEACIVQSILNAADAELDGIDINTQSIDWGSLYDKIKASYAAGNPPDIHIMHRHRIPEFAGIGALADISSDLEAAGIDIADWAPAARDAVSFNGGIYGVPFDIHAILFHVNLDLLAAAGLVENGKPILPSSPGELLEHARLVKEATGVDYFTAEFGNGMLGVRAVLAWIWQQGGNVFDGDTATLDTEEARNALNAIPPLFEEGLVRNDLGYADAQQAFLNGDAAILINGTWVVDFYDAEAKKADVPLNNYYVADFPSIFGGNATWADSHMWAVPASLKANDPAKYQEALRVLAFINDHNGDWARTGHMAVRTSVLESDYYNNLPHRNEYVATAANATDVPPAEKYSAIQDVLGREFQSTWLTGKSVDDALADAQVDVQDLLD